MFNSYQDIIILATHVSTSGTPQKLLQILKTSQSGSPYWRKTLDLLTTPSIEILPNTMIEGTWGFILWDNQPSLTKTQYILYEWGLNAISQVITTSVGSTVGQYIARSGDQIYIGINFADGMFALQKYEIQGGSVGYQFRWQKKCCGTKVFTMSAIFKAGTGDIMMMGQYDNDKLTFAVVNSDIKDGNWLSSSGTKIYGFFKTTLSGQTINSDLNYEMSIAESGNIFTCHMDPTIMNPVIMQMYFDNQNSITILNSWKLNTRFLAQGKQMCHSIFASSIQVVALFQDFEKTQDLAALVIYRNDQYMAWMIISTHHTLPRYYRHTVLMSANTYKIFTYGKFQTRLDCVAEPLSATQYMGMINTPMDKYCMSATYVNYGAYLNDTSKITKGTNLPVTYETDTYTQVATTAEASITYHLSSTIPLQSPTNTLINVNRTCQTIEQITYQDLFFLPQQGTQTFTLPRTRPQARNLEI
ncbi:hypothetical protein FGO68_gene16425 [Halteria grandinella]|uniref:Uncharacterized protein n=1 Tax=Halteria grandinella TaxID=5974 RepID=A0A8J8NGM5_HALGN|nr:hypothetical protein FGO68_gene16425 [Halteria grandinella]